MLTRLNKAWAMLKSCGFLSSERFRSFFLYTKEPLESLMFGSMIRQSWFVALGASPIYIVMMPMFSFVLIGLALVDIYELCKAKDKSLDLWLNALIGSTCACLATTSIALLEISLLTGLTYAIGPWFFLGSVSLFFCNASFQTGLNIWRACHEPLDSQSRLDKIQSAINWAFIATTVASVIGCVIFVILFADLCVTAGAISAGLTVTLTAMSLIWRMTPDLIKSELKQEVGLEKSSSDIKSGEFSSLTRSNYCIQGSQKQRQAETMSWLYSSRTNNDQELPANEALGESNSSCMIPQG